MSATGTCTVRDVGVRFRTAGEVHPEADFFGPGQPLPEAAFGQVLGDGHIVVLDRPGLPAAEIDQLRAFVYSVARTEAAEYPGQVEPVRLLNAFDMLTCTQFDLAAVRSFANSWFADPRSGSRS